MDAYSGYNQIPLLKEDQDKTAFVTQTANYCYTMMPFGLKNAGATYQRMMNEVFKDLIGDSIEVYIDDMISKSQTPEQHLTHLQGVFNRLRKYNMRLNPSKCAFGVPAGKFLGFMLTEREFGVLQLSCPPVLTKPDIGEILYLYLSVGVEAISAALVREPNGEAQKPVYFISKVLQGAELRYQQVEKVILTLIFAARRLRPYFQCHPITVRTNQPIRQVLQKPDLAGRMMSWAIELSEYQINYEPRTAIKAQALADFIAEMTHTTASGNQLGETLATWKLFVDGSTNAKGSGAGLIVENPDGVTMEHSLTFDFNTTNNQAEYEALIAGLLQARELGAQHLKVFSDSQLVTCQISGEYQAKGSLMCKYLEIAKDIMETFMTVKVEHIRRGENTRADILAKLASTKSPGNNRSVIQHNLQTPCVVMSITGETDEIAADTWITPIANYLSEGFSTPLLKCLNPGDMGYGLEEIHEGINGHHIGGHSLARKALRAGFCWPTMERDAYNHVKKCDKCQRFADVHRAPPEELTLITSPWPFHKWGMDILGPFPKATGRIQWLIVAIDYFTKWVEAEAVATITSQKVRKFFWRNVVYRFGIPGEVITDNGTQFTDSKFRELMTNLQIWHHFAAVEHPQSNGLVESANKMLSKGIKKKLTSHKGAWLENLHGVLWGYRTTAQSSTGETPFRLIYGAEAMIPVEIGEPSWRKEQVTEVTNRQGLKETLDLIEEIRERAAQSDRQSKERSASRYNSRVILRKFQTFDLVLRRADVGNKNAQDGKLAPNWEGPYRIAK
ncbi:uncharacterized protein LOC133315664, partial [Gastrolobium bilobum]|uniref:uncharacterized protein LOC133315664 n=1 Tax=Gastrolobium bilobum TaxID=150636 RepID=UPI002AB30B02